VEDTEKTMSIKLNRNPKPSLHFCFPDDSICIKHSNPKKTNAFRNDYQFNYDVRAKRNYCGKSFTVDWYNSKKNPVKSYSVPIDVNFVPSVPVVKRAHYDVDEDCLSVEISPEDTGNCRLQYTVKYDYGAKTNIVGTFNGTMSELQLGTRFFKHCFDQDDFKDDLYDHDMYPNVTVSAMSMAAGGQSSAKSGRIAVSSAFTVAVTVAMQIISLVAALVFVN